MSFWIGWNHGNGNVCSYTYGLNSPCHLWFFIFTWVRPATERKKSHFPFHLHSWGQRWLWGLLFLLQSALVFILWPAGTKASNYLTFTWESLRLVVVVVAVVWDTEWVRLNYKGFARPLSHWQVLGHKVTSLLSGGCRVWRRNKQREQVVFWIIDVWWVGVWYG